MRKVALAALAAAPLLAGGCGTVGNLCLSDEYPKRFGGARYDLHEFGNVFDIGASNSQPGGGEFSSVLAFALVFLPIVDVPLSVVGDAMTYPIARQMDLERNPPRPNRPAAAVLGSPVPSVAPDE